MGSINNRLRRLEEQGPRCPECGLSPNGPREIAVVNKEHPEESFEGDPHASCARCGEPLYAVIRVVYEGAAGDEGEGGVSYEPL